MVAAINLLLMRKPPRPGESLRVAVLIPARNEADKIGPLVAALRAQKLPVIVFDDASEDETASIATANGARVIHCETSLPEGWLGKNRACHELAQFALDRPIDWFIFLDADVTPRETFGLAVAGMVDFARQRAAAGSPTVVTGIPRIVSGTGIEPLFMAWVGWLILAFDPFGLVSRTGKGHVRFLNGQFQIWPSEVYRNLMPHEAMRAEVMEDVMIGRLLAKKKVPVEVFQIAEHLEVRMYKTWAETLDGFSKNAYCITGSVAGTIALATLLVGFAAISATSVGGLAFLILSGLTVAMIAQAALWPAFLMPMSLVIGAGVLIRSLIWHRTGRVRWKGRTIAKS